MAALNRNTFARYLNSATLPDGNTLYDYVSSNCYLPQVTVTYDASTMVVTYEYGLSPWQTPTVTYPSSGNPILTYSYNSGTISDQAGHDGFWGKMELSSTFNMSVTVQGNTIVIAQHLVIYTYVKFLATADSGNIVDITITDTYSLGADDEGNIVISQPSADATPPTSIRVDASKNPKANGFLNFWANVDSLSDDVKQWAASCAATSLTDIPVSFMKNFVFPGNATFGFADVSFSDNQDLTSHITFADVS